MNTYNGTLIFHLLDFPLPVYRYGKWFFQDETDYKELKEWYIIIKLILHRIKQLWHNYRNDSSKQELKHSRSHSPIRTRLYFKLVYFTKHGVCLSASCLHKSASNLEHMNKIISTPTFQNLWHITFSNYNQYHIILPVHMQRCNYYNLTSNSPPSVDQPSWKVFPAQIYNLFNIMQFE